MNEITFYILAAIGGVWLLLKLYNIFISFWSSYQGRKIADEYLKENQGGKNK